MADGLRLISKLSISRVGSIDRNLQDLGLGMGSGIRILRTGWEILFIVADRSLCFILVHGIKAENLPLKFRDNENLAS